MTAAQKKIVAASQRWECATCETLLTSTFQVDHRVALFEGGTNDMANLAALCVACHAAKTQEEAIRRAARKARLAASSSKCYECHRCGVVFSPYFRHTCAGE